MKWTCLQLGSREHYAVPRALLLDQSLACLLTDVWSNPRGGLEALLGKVRPAFKQRRHESIPDCLVRSNSFGRLVHDGISTICGKRGWELILSRNEWFQQWAVEQFDAKLLDQTDVIFSYSYTAARPFRLARQAGCKTVLGQIDPGPLEDVVVAELAQAYQHLAPAQAGPPSRYWDAWREEVDGADTIVVNSAWSADLLSRAGVPAGKLREIPLAYDAAGLPDRLASSAGKSYPQEFTPERPLRVLFLGQVILRKGAGQLFDAMRELAKAPVHFTIAGPLGVKVPDEIRTSPKVVFTGPVDSATCRRLYTAADVFILPTLSDGFALTQLEAQAFGLPLVVSRNCGRVVRHRENGLLLEQPTAECITAALLQLAADPAEVRGFAENSRVDGRFSLAALATSLPR